MKLRNFLKFGCEVKEDLERIDMPLRRDFIRKSVAALAGVVVLGDLGEAEANPKTPAQLQYDRHLQVAIEDAVVELRSLKSEEEYDLELVKELIERSNLMRDRLSSYYSRGYHVYDASFYKTDKSGMIKQLDSVYFDYRDFNGELAQFIIDKYELEVKPMTGVTPNDLEVLDDGTIILDYPIRIQGIETIMHEITIHPDGTITDDFRVTYG